MSKNFDFVELIHISFGTTVNQLVAMIIICVCWIVTFGCSLCEFIKGRGCAISTPIEIIKSLNQVPKAAECVLISSGAPSSGNQKYCQIEESVDYYLRNCHRGIYINGQLVKLGALEPLLFRLPNKEKKVSGQQRVQYWWGSDMPRSRF